MRLPSDHAPQLLSVLQLQGPAISQEDKRVDFSMPICIFQSPIALPKHTSRMVAISGGTRLRLQTIYRRSRVTLRPTWAMFWWHRLEFRDPDIEKVQTLVYRIISMNRAVTWKSSKHIPSTRHAGIGELVTY